MVGIRVCVFVVLRNILELLVAQIAIEGFEHSRKLGFDRGALGHIFLSGCR